MDTCFAYASPILAGLAGYRALAATLGTAGGNLIARMLCSGACGP
jgi:hypothetical protein